MQLYCESVGTQGPALLLLHGMACNGAIWKPLLHVLRGRWPGRILVPDLRGHGRSAHASHYGLGQHAGDIAQLLEPGERATVVAHSMGTPIALAVATGWYGASIDTIIGFGVKLHFSDADIEKSMALARAPVKWFDTRAEAVDRFLRFSGLAGLVADDAEVVAAGVCEENGRWRVRTDPKAFSVAGPRFEDLFRAAKCRLHLACGSEDPLVKIDEMRRFDPEAIELPGLGHSFHVDAPEALAGLMQRLF